MFCPGGIHLAVTGLEEVDAGLTGRLVGRFSKAGNKQVWSLTKLYSVDFSRSKVSKKSAFSTNAKSRSASAVLTVS